MAGTERSGRRKIAKPDPSVQLPEPGNTEESIRACMDAVFRGVRDGSVDPRYAETFIKAATVSLRSVAQQKAQADTAELRRLLVAAEGLVHAGQAKENADREHRGPKRMRKSERWHEGAKDVPNL